MFGVRDGSNPLTIFFEPALSPLPLANYFHIGSISDFFSPISDAFSVASEIQTRSKNSFLVFFHFSSISSIYAFSLFVQPCSSGRFSSLKK